MEIESFIRELRSELSGQTGVLKKILNRTEKEILRQVMHDYKLNKAAASRYLGTSKSNIRNRLHLHFGNEYDRCDI